MDNINYKDLFKYFKEKVNLLLFITLLSVIAGTIYMIFLKTPEYSSYTTILLTKTSEDNTSIDQTDITLNQKLVTTYSEIIKSRRIMKQVIDNLDLDYSIEELSKNVKVTSVNDTEIIKIDVTDVDNNKAAEIANDIADVFSKEIVELYNIKNIGIIDKAEVSDNPSNVSPIKEEVIYIGIGVIISLIIIFIKYYFDSSIKNIEDIENIIGLPVIGTIPLKNRKKGKTWKKN